MKLPEVSSSDLDPIINFFNAVHVPTKACTQAQLDALKPEDVEASINILRNTAAKYAETLTKLKNYLLEQEWMIGDYTMEKCPNCSKHLLCETPTGKRRCDDCNWSPELNGPVPVDLPNFSV